MKFFLVALAVVAAVAAEPPSTNYGGPEHTPQTFKHVYVHAAPDEPEDRQARVIRVPGGDKHVNIIFVKTPSSSSSQQTEVILPDQDEHKNLVYVLLKKGENTADIKVRRPPARQPQKPDVYFIRYKDGGAAGYGGAASSGSSSGGSFGGAPTPVRAPSQAYGF